ncbi:double zinc ribbon domain-containing protein [Geoalkalibacter halelectricus]|uniref:DZANK-type domain-containing protein n=1 Tax=Geoalkalibacter halelectricus TaxID=2847045 RepID=A0ABY5ZLZ9_9BACT|nr:zinc ribbon domain-containing protein [Geoalkalibacter halelectricus]MDO3379368.1 hypothetical protein [Geoalkalibacter halelectricus]UWZ78754.1 hypothetical protein L9S41_13850 [Geoalkalibacter halelectricus]
MVLIFLLTFAGLGYLILTEFERREHSREECTETLCDCGQTVQRDWLSCPRCSQLLRVSCAFCGRLKARLLRFCPSCGSAAASVEENAA